MADKIKRVDQAPQIEVIYQSIVDGTVERRDDIKRLLDLVNHIEGPYAILLDGAWGTGKTFFLHQVMLSMAVCNEGLGPYVANELDQGLLASLRNALPGTGVEYSTNGPNGSDMQDGTFPIYFNAWEFDYADDPVLPLLTVIAGALGLDFEELGKRSPKLREALQGFVSSFSLSALSLSLGFGAFPVSLGAELGRSSRDKEPSLKDMLVPFESKRQLRDAIAQLLSEGLPDGFNRALVIIDELDRCRPELAIRVLEATKFLLDLSNVTLLISANAQALGASISAWYGSGFDGSRYLMRFYDQVVRLTSFDAVLYLESLGVRVRRDSIAAHLCSRLTMRDLNRCSREISELVRFDDSSSSPQEFLRRIFDVHIPLGAVLFSTAHPDRRHALIAGDATDELAEWLAPEEGLLRALLDLKGNFFEGDPLVSTSDAMSEEVHPFALGRLRRVLNVVFGEENQVPFFEELAPGLSAGRVRIAVRSRLQSAGWVFDEGLVK